MASDLRYAPLIAVQKFGTAHPRVWGVIDDLVNAVLSGEIPADWNHDVCYCPVSAALSALTADMPVPTATGLAAYAAALAAWRRGKYIYEFDSDLADELIKTAADLVVPVDIVRCLPAQCIFVSLPSDSDVAGFFAFIEHDVETHQEELRIIYINHGGELTAQYIVHLIPGATISDGIDAAIKTIEENIRNLSQRRAVDFLNAARQSTIEAVQFVLYLCSENAEMREDPVQAGFYRKSSRIVDRVREVRKWDVGTEIGAILRKARNYDAENANDESAPDTADNAAKSERKYKVRPHMRRAHWHHFWAGSRDDRKLILRWINSTIVNAKDGEAPVTVIKKGK